MKIAVIDGQGGGIGKHITMKLRETMPEYTEIFGLGTNAVATAAMLRAGANEGATGESAIAYMASQVDIIVGSISIIAANSMFGEVTPKIVEAIGSSKAKKIMLPVNRSDITIVGIQHEPVPHQIDKLIEIINNIRR
ncbi:MAG: DUF3842 family protein [Clostridiales bacterium]